jgi:hypothetical protein
MRVLGWRPVARLNIAIPQEFKYGTALYIWIDKKLSGTGVAPATLIFTNIGASAAIKP